MRRKIPEKIMDPFPNIVKDNKPTSPGILENSNQSIKDVQNIKKHN